MASMHSMSEILFNQVEQIADVKTCNIDNVEQKYYKVQWKCTWEPAAVLERFCSKIIADYNKHPKPQIETVEKTKHNNVTANNVSININENSVVNVNTEIDKEDSYIASNLFNKGPSKIYATNNDALNESLPLNDNSNKNNLTQHKFDSVNNLTFNNFTIKPDPDQEIFPNINILCESNLTTFNHGEESNTTNRDQNKGLLPYSADVIIHTGEKPFKCELCSFSTSQKSYIKRHMLVHTGEKSFKCQLCSFSTSLKSTLKTHMSRHTGEYPFKCHLCSYSTSRKHVLKQHHISKHT